MPTYDFICNKCNQRFDVFLTYSEYGKKTVTCAHCGSKDVRRRMTRVRIAKSEESRMDSMADEFSGLEGLENDPQAMGKMMRKMGKEMGRTAARIRRRLTGLIGQPGDIEKAIPDLGGDGEAGGGDDE
jgi:putative FmdB family regulatory protein